MIDLESHAERLFLIRRYGRESGFKTINAQNSILRKFSDEDQGRLMALVAQMGNATHFTAASRISLGVRDELL